MNSSIRVMITREGWYYLAMLVFIIAGAVIRDINLLYIMAGMMLGPLLFSLLAATRGVRKLQLRRQFRSLIGVGEVLHVEVTASKATAAPQGFAVEVRDLLHAASQPKTRQAAGLLFPHVPSGGQATAEYSVRLQRRGRYQLGPMRVSTSQPIGLIRATTSGPGVEEVLVSPRLGRLLPAWKRQFDLQHEGGQKSTRRQGQREGDFYGMREWRNGDSRNWIHWRTSAKRNKLAVRQFEQRINQDLVIVLDLQKSSESAGSVAVQPDATDDSIEQAISFVATLVVEQARRGSTHLVVASASQQGFLLQGASSSVFQQELLERLALVEPTEEDHLPDVLAEVLPKATSKSRILVVSTRDLDLRDTDQYAEIWQRTELRRLIGNVFCVNTQSDDFPKWFQSAANQQPIMGR